MRSKHDRVKKDDFNKKKWNCDFTMVFMISIVVWRLPVLKGTQCKTEKKLSCRCIPLLSYYSECFFSRRVEKWHIGPQSIILSVWLMTKQWQGWRIWQAWCRLLAPLWLPDECRLIETLIEIYFVPKSTPAPPVLMVRSTAHHAACKKQRKGNWTIYHRKRVQYS